MISEEQLYKKLDNLDIPYKIVKHKPVFTTEEADKQIEGHEGVRTKSMFLTNKKKTKFFIVIMDDSKRLDLKYFKELVDESRVKLASPESTEEVLGLTPGVVSVFGLIEENVGLIDVYYDKEMLEEDILTFHPNINDKTIFLKTEDLLRYVSELGYEKNIVDLPD